MKFKAIEDCLLAQAAATEAHSPDLPKANFYRPPPTLADRFMDLQPGISCLLLALLLAWLIHTLWRPRDVVSPQRWRLLCLGFLAVSVGLIGPLLLPFANSENPSLSTTLAGLCLASLGFSIMSFLASLISRRTEP